MRLLSIALLFITGALLVATDAFCASFSPTGHSPKCDDYGYLIMVISGILFIIEWWPTPVTKDANRPATTGPQSAPR